MFESWIENIGLYTRQRFPLRVFAPVSLILSAAAFAGGWPERWLSIFLSVVASAVLVFQFRLWDDLGDRSYDVVHHPLRVLSRADRLSAFHRLLLLCGLANFIFLLLLGRSYPMFLLLNAAAMLWYGAVPVRWRRSIAGRHLMLAKYPGFVWLVAPMKPDGPAVKLSMGIVYLCCAIYELFHDDEIRLRPAARVLMAVEMCILGGLAAFILRALVRTLMLPPGASL